MCVLSRSMYNYDSSYSQRVRNFYKTYFSGTYKISHSIQSLFRLSKWIIYCYQGLQRPETNYPNAPFLLCISLFSNGFLLLSVLDTHTENFSRVQMLGQKIRKKMYSYLKSYKFFIDKLLSWGLHVLYDVPLLVVRAMCSNHVWAMNHMMPNITPCFLVEFTIFCCCKNINYGINKTEP